MITSCIKNSVLKDYDVRRDYGLNELLSACNGLIEVLLIRIRSDFAVVGPRILLSQKQLSQIKPVLEVEYNN